MNDVRVAAAELCAKARDVLAERGWTQGTLQADDGAVCAVGALKVACEGNTVALRYKAAYYAVADTIGCSSVSGWNDEPGRTYEDVVAAFKQAEERLLDGAS